MSKILQFKSRTKTFDLRPEHVKTILVGRNIYVAYNDNFKNVCKDRYQFEKLMIT